MKRIILLDGNSLMYRAYYATAYSGSLLKNDKGLYTNAIYAFIKMMDELLKDPYDNILVAFDAGKETFRHKDLPSYKGGRSPMPDELRMQIPYIKDYLKRMNILSYELPLYEADDIIGSMAKLALEAGYHVDIYSSDKDLLQLIDKNSTVHLTRKGMSELDDYTPEFFKEKYDLEYTQMVDLKALMGDPSDNLKGINGVGEKTAIKLLNEYKTLENIIENKDKIKGKLGENIQNYYEDALMCQKICTINRESPLTISLDDTIKKEKDVEQLLELFNYLGFRSLIKGLGEVKKEINYDYQVIDNILDLKAVLLDSSYLYFEMDQYNYHKANLLAIGLCNEKGIFIIKPELLDQSIDLQLFLLDENKKNVFDLKRMKVYLLEHGYDLKGIDYDMMLASYLLAPQIKNNDFSSVCHYFDVSVPFDDDIYGKGAKYHVPEEEILYPFIAKKVYSIKILKEKTIAKLKEYQQLSLLNDIEIPLAFVLAKMEFNGIKIDKEELASQKAEVLKEINMVEEKIYELASTRFNIQSPKQLGEILFEKLALPVVKRNKNGYSTDVDVLNYLKNKHEIIPYILKHRTLSKLYNSYLANMDELIYPDGKVHTIFEQALTVTGRLSSIEPNVQNIPIRTNEGKKIRKFFVPEDNNWLFSSDYSQVELRVLAHMANSKGLIESFNEGLDVHAETAKKIFKVEEVTPELRRRAKAVNFGIVYGISAFGLSEGTDLTPKEAKVFIDQYFLLYPEVKQYMDDTIDFAMKNGYVLTLLNRRRYIPELQSSVYMQREFGKRTAMNAPIQGSAADIIKIAMIKIDKKMEELGLKSKMIFQVHDELVFEVFDEEKHQMEELVTELMQQAFKLDVRLDVDFGFGKNWMEAK